MTLKPPPPMLWIIHADEPPTDVKLDSVEPDGFDMLTLLEAAVGSKNPEQVAGFTTYLGQACKAFCDPRLNFNRPPRSRYGPVNEAATAAWADSMNLPANKIAKLIGGVAVVTGPKDYLERL